MHLTAKSMVWKNGIGFVPYKRAIKSEIETIKHSSKKTITELNSDFKHEYKKELFKKYNIPYLLPSETWSSKEITEKIDNFKPIVDELSKRKILNKNTLQDAINKYFPESKGRITIKDYKDLEQDLRKQNYDEEKIKQCLNSKAHTASSPSEDKSILYFKFDLLNGDEIEKLSVNECILHELIHSFSFHFQNTKKAHMLNNHLYKLQHRERNFLKLELEKKVILPKKEDSRKLTEENKLEMLGVSSMEKYHKSIRSKLKKIIKIREKNNDFIMPQGEIDKKRLFNYLEYTTKEELNAYRYNYHGYSPKDKSIEMNYDLIRLKQAEMKKALHQEKIDMLHKHIKGQKQQKSH